MKIIALTCGVFTILFSIFFDFLFINPYYFGPAQLILLLAGISLIVLYFSNKYFLINISFIIGISFTIINSNYFLNISESPLIKTSVDKLDKNIIDLEINEDDLNKLQKYYFKSQNFIDQSQYIKFFSNKKKKINRDVNINLDKELIAKIGETHRKYPNPCP